MKVYDRIKVDQWFMATLGLLILALALYGILHGVRASVAAQLSRDALYGPSSNNVEYVLSRCQRVFKLYPRNYLLSIHAAELAYYKAAEEPDLYAERRRQSLLWCDRGLMQNPYKIQLRRLKTRFLWEKSPAEAIAYWDAYTDWQYWEPFNHATRAELHAQNGNFEKAEQAIKVIVNFPEYAVARAVIDSEKKEWGE